MNTLNGFGAAEGARGRAELADLTVLHGCATIQLSRGQNTLIDSRDYSRITEWKWFALPSHGEYYAARTLRPDRRVNHKKQTIRMHRVVLETRVGPCPPGQEGRHLNGDSLDNRSENLAWGTHLENCRDAQRHGSYERIGILNAGKPNPHNKGEGNASAKLKTSDIPEVRRRHTEGESQSSLARRFKVSRMAIWKIIEGKSWSHA